RTATMLDTGCCGMAGAFGMLAEKYELSVQVAADLIGKIDNVAGGSRAMWTGKPARVDEPGGESINQPLGTTVVASGTSCRHQLNDLSKAQPKHMAEVIADAL
ncbi:MAG: hypothetical protein QOE73_644, partial [Verrucomicrobiota bacterium]